MDVKNLKLKQPNFPMILSADMVLIFQVYANNGISARGSALMGLGDDLL